MAKKVEPHLTDEYIQHAFEWAKKSTGKGRFFFLFLLYFNLMVIFILNIDKIDGDTFMDLVWLYVTIPGPAPELDVFFVYWK